MAFHRRPPPRKKFRFRVPQVPLVQSPEWAQKIGFCGEEVLKQLRGVSINSLFISEDWSSAKIGGMTAPAK
jgi:hypothetical protein